jgi:hypothetical protein
MVSKVDPSDVKIFASRGPGKSVNVEAKRNGQTIAAKTFAFNNAERRHAFAKKFGVPDELVMDAMKEAMQPEATTTAAEPNQPAPFSVTLRGLSQSKNHGEVLSRATPLAALQAALAITDYKAAEPVIEWVGTTLLAALDIDFHHQEISERPTPAHLQAMALLVRPGAALYWYTHGRGLRLVFTAAQGLTAAELAACATVSIRSHVPGATIEILSRTRHPSYPRPDYPPAGQVIVGVPTADIGALATYLGREADAGAVEEWLADHCLVKGRRYDHGHCPIDPQAPSHGEPVVVFDDGIHCHKCQANRIALGSKKPGWFSWSALVCGAVSSRLKTAVRHFCHWEHAQHIVAEEIGLTGERARLCYQALLTATHKPNDPRIVEAMARGSGLVRMDGYWATADLGRAHLRDGLSERLAKLPAVATLGWDKDHRSIITGADPERLGTFRGVDDLSGFGYPRVEPVRGMKIFHHWHHNKDPHVVRAVVLPDFLQPEKMRPFRPRYIAKSERMPPADVEAVVNTSFPGINMNYLRLLVAARGCSEGRIGQPPLIAVDGPSGSGKSMTVAVAAALIGDNHVDVPLGGDLEHFHQGLYEASTNAGLVTSDEIVKLATSRRASALTSLNALLTFTRGSMIRKLYVGPVVARQMPVIVITDISFPHDLLCDEQLGRRFVHVHLEHKVDWQHTVMSLVAMVNGQIIAWAPLLDNPLPVEQIWPDGFGQPLPVRSFAGPDFPTPLAQAVESGRPFCAHNANDFDARIWRAKGLPAPSAWIDTLPDARAAGFPGKLDEISGRLLGRGKDKRGAALVKKLCHPDQEGRFLPLTTRRIATIMHYNIADVLLLAGVFGSIKGSSEPDVVAIDGVINERGVYFDADLARSLIALEKHAAVAAAAEVEKLTGGALTSGDLRRNAKLSKWLAAKGVQLPDLQRTTISRRLASGSLEPVVAKVLQARLVVTRITTAKLERGLAVVGHDSRLRDTLVYHGAQTGRWAGRTLQPHNLPRPHKDLQDLQ